MILYGSTLSPFVRKCSAYAAEKGIEIEVVFASSDEDKAKFAAASPFGKMPAFYDAEFAICDSSAIIHYLEAKFPEPNLIPAEPRARARTIWFEEFADTIMMEVGAKIFGNRFVRPRVRQLSPNLDAAEEAERDGLPALFDYLETQIPDSGFLVEDRITLADIAVASPVATLSCLRPCIDDGKHPRVAQYMAAILARPSFAPVLARDKAFVAKLGGGVFAADPAVA